MKRLWLLLSLLVVLFPLSAEEGKKAPQLPVDPSLIEGVRSGRSRILLNFEDVDIRLLARLVADLTGKSIVIDERVRGKISIFSATEVTASEAWQMFLAALEAYGYGVIPKKGYVKIVPLATARQQGVVMGPPKALEGFGVTLIKLKNANAEQLQNTLRLLLSANGVISAYIPANALVISDDLQTIRRVTELAKQLDRKDNRQQLRIFHPRYLQSKDLAAALTNLLSDKPLPIKVSSYDRTNSLIVLALPQYFKEIEEIVRSLDTVESQRAEGEVRDFKIYYLENANAEDVAKTLSEMLSERRKVEQVGAQPGTTPGAYSPETGVAPGKPRTFISEKVSSDPSTNSLVLYMSDSEFKSVEGVIKKLDVPRKQVLISALVAEVSLKKLQEVGAKWQVLTNKGMAGFQGGLTTEGLFNLLASGSLVVGGFSEKSRELTISGNKVTIPDIAGLIALLETDSNFHILSAPRLLTLDHKEANMSVGSVIPFATGVKFDAVGQPVISYDYKEVGLKLRATPHISQAKQVRLELKSEVQEITDFLKPNIGSFSYVVPITSKREVNTTVTVEDTQTIILGGLISHKTVENVKKVPGLAESG
ncbi:MAG: type II secretion system secretin GspD [Armatimonadetes bacterium]|nr:type II secretion system secretin GspD [Armatimonadota bacterium]